MSIDYKKIIKSQDTRLKILRLLSFVPDKTMIKFQYWVKTGHRLNLKNPKRFTEKLQWYKLYYKNPIMVKLVDKYDVRDYVESKGLQQILIPCFGVYESIDEIDWNSLPNQFVMKDTLGSGGNSVIIVKDKNNVNIEEIKTIAKKWTDVNVNKKDAGREWPYYSGKNHRIIIEQYLDSEPENGGLIDYKFFCMNGRVTYIYVIADRKLGAGAGLAIYDRDFNRIKAQRVDERILNRHIRKPKNFLTLRAVAEKLAGEFPEVRIDLYDNNDVIRFGEFTFFDGSGYMKFEPDSFDYEFGKVFNINDVLS